MSRSVPPEALGKLGRLALLHKITKLDHGVEAFRYGGVRQPRQVVGPVL